MYKDGKVKDHEGSWLAGVNGAKAGLMMPGLPLIGASYFQELAQGVAMDRARIESLEERMTTPAGEFANVLKIAESTPLEKFAHENKYYAAGIGLIQDGSLKLIKHGVER